MCNCSAATLKYKKVTHCIFDLDGLLLDSEAIYQQVIADIFEENDVKYSSEVHRKLLGITSADTWKMAVEEFGIQKTPEELLADYSNRTKKLIKGCQLLPGAERLIRHLYKNNVPIAVATSSTQRTCDIKIAHVKCLFSMFHHIVAGGNNPEIEKGKPSPDIFLYCASKFNEKPAPAQCLVFEDAPNGVKAAIDAGMQCVVVPDPFISIDECRDATVIINALDEFQPEQFGLPPY